MKITNKTRRVIPFFGSSESKLNLNYDLVKSGSELELIILNLGLKRAALNITARIRHAAPNTKSRVTVRSVLYDRASVNFKGNILIEKGAKNADTYLAHNTLMMSPLAFSSTIPSLEINNNDVHAGHNATIGEVDRDQLFYLECRGIPRSEAEKLLVRAFLESQINFIPDELEKCLMQK